MMIQSNNPFTPRFSAWSHAASLIIAVADLNGRNPNRIAPILPNLIEATYCDADP